MRPLLACLLLLTCGATANEPPRAHVQCITSGRAVVTISLPDVDYIVRVDCANLI